MRRTYLGLVAVLAAAGCSDVTGARAIDVAPPNEVPETKTGQWPRFHGPNSNLISSEQGWAVEWPAEGPPKLWTMNVGTGFSSVSISDGRLFTMGHRDGNDTVYCLDAETGKEIWKHSYACKLVANLHEGGPAATPTIDGDRVYTLSKEGHLFCFGFEKGNVLWSAELQKLLEVPMPEWGFSCSPLVVGEKLIIEAGRTSALNKESGEVLWKTDAFRAGYGSPVVFEVDGQRLLTVLNNDFLLVLRLDDGSEVARQKWESSFATVATTPIVAGRTIFISSGYNQGCALLELQDGELDVVYTNKKMSNHMNNCVLWEGHLYGFDGNSHARRTVALVCMEYATGDVKWEERGLGCGSLMLADGKLIALGDEGELVIAEPSPNGFRPISRAQVIEGKCWTVPVLAGGRIYCRNAAGDLVALDVKKNAPKQAAATRRHSSDNLSHVMKQETAKLQGRWHLESYEYGSEKSVVERDPQIWEFADNGLSIYADDPEYTDVMSWQVQPNEKPKHMDLIPAGDRSKLVARTLCLYSLEGDELKIATTFFFLPGNPAEEKERAIEYAKTRPKSFDTSQGDVQVFTLKRAKQDET